MATKEEARDLLAELERHCRAPIMSVDAKVLWLSDWASDLASYPTDGLRAAVRAWRQRESKFPNLTQLVALIPKRVEGGKNRPWEPLSDDAYDALTLEGKIDHQRILAHECGMRAGAQWAHGRPVPSEDMPSVWHTWKRRQAGHFAEAKRLYEMLRTSRMSHAPLRLAP